MLVRLRIKDYILIDELEVDFSEGFNVLTGETGAGKSILLGALRLVLGERIQGELIRVGAKKAVIQAQFSCRQLPENLIEQFNIDLNDYILLTRELMDSGKSTCKINGELCTLSELRLLSERLLTIHGQHDHQLLTHSDQQLQLLDQGLDAMGKKALSCVEELFSRYNTYVKQLNQLEQDPTALERQLDLIGFQMEDIDQVALTLEDEGLESRLEAMKHSESIIQELEISRHLIESDQDDFNLVKTFHDLIRRMDRYERYLPEYTSKKEWLTDILYQIKELADQQEASIGQLQYDPYELLTLEKRLDAINHLKRKYGNTISGILQFREELETQQVQCQMQMGMKDKLVLLIEQTKAEYDEWAAKVSQFRSERACDLERELVEQLGQLNFKDAQIAVQLTARNNMSIRGNEHMELMVSLNKGMALAPLKRVASGGEISRLMLAIKAIAANKDQVESLIFDEIDSGISGHTASVVSEKLYQVSGGRQVICITHLAQVALMADAHFLIEKSSEQDMTVSRVVALNDDGRVLEIARIMGGSSEVASVRDNARELLREARQKKE